MNGAFHEGQSSYLKFQKIITRIQIKLTLVSRGVPLRRLKYDYYYPHVWINSGKPSKNDR